jgi:hypothetical protein
MQSSTVAGAALAALWWAAPALAGSCAHLNNCNKHGTCDTENSRCQCYVGYGADSDVALYKAPDCSLREFRDGS